MRPGWVACLVGGLSLSACARGEPASTGAPPGGGDDTHATAPTRPDGGAGAGGDAGARPPYGGGPADPGRPPPPPFADRGPPPAAEACTLPLDLGRALSVAPAAPGQRYARCGSIGPGAGWHVTLSPDGAHLAARTSLGTVRLIAADGWREVAHLAAPVGRLDAVAFSPAGAHLAVLASEAGEITTWRTRDGALEQTFAAPPGPTVDLTASALAYSSDGTRLATSLATVIDLPAGASSTWWSGAANAPPYALKANPARLTDGESFRALRFLAGDSLVFMELGSRTGNSSSSTTLATLNTRDLTRAHTYFGAWDVELRGHALSPDGRLLALSSYGSSTGDSSRPVTQVVRTIDAVEVATSTDVPGTILAFSADGARLAAQSGTTVEIWDASSFALTSRYSVPPGAAFLAAAPTGALVFSTPDSTYWLDFDSGAVLDHRPFHLREVTWSADGRVAAGTGQGALFHYWRTDGSDRACAPIAASAPAAPSPFALEQFRIMPDWTQARPSVDVGGFVVEQAAVSTDGTLVGGRASPGDLGASQVGVWRRGTAQPIWTATGELWGPAAFAPDGGIFVASLYAIHTHATDFTAFSVWDAADGTLLRRFGADAGFLAVTPNGDRLATRESAGDWAVWCR